MSNACATVEPGRRPQAVIVALLVLLLQFAFSADVVSAQAQQENSSAASASRTNRAATVGWFLAGAAIGLGAHEAGHLVLDVAFDADPGVRKVNFHGIPFFAITHSGNLSPAQAFAVASAGFWVQHAGTEWLLTRRPHLRRERAPLAKGLFAFNVLASSAYAGAAFFRTGPEERDTLGMARTADVDERWIGLSILAPALLDTWRYFHPGSRGPVWASRALKVAGALLIVRAAARAS